MANESTEIIRRKHRLSPSDDTNNEDENPSKHPERRRHHHRHHHHHHHHHHEHRHHHKRCSKKEGNFEEETERKVEVEEKRNHEIDIVGGSVPSATLSGEVAMEEGEIVETHQGRTRSGGSGRNSPDRSKGRSRSQSVVREDSLPDSSKRFDDSYRSKRKHRSSSDDELVEVSRNHRHASNCLPSDEERKNSTSDRRISRSDTHDSRESWDKNREGSQDLGRERHNESMRERDRESIRDRHRNKKEKQFSHSKLNDDGVLDRDRRHDGIDSKGRPRESDQEEKVNNSEANLSETESEKSKRETEEYQKKVLLQLEALEEEENFEKIIEESRRRRKLATLENHKTLNSQHQQPEPEHAEKEQVEQMFLMVDSEFTGDRIDTDDHVADRSFSVVNSPSPNEKSTSKKQSVDMFSDDIFGESPAGVSRTGDGDGLTVGKSGQSDNWDDPEGYYRYRYGEILDGRYEIIAAHGKGVFSTVVRAKDLKAESGEPEEVAIKIIRSNETMYKAGIGELAILNRLVIADPENQCHCVRLLSSFNYRNHLCLVFESLHMDLRLVLKKYGRDIGLKLTAVRAYAKQLFQALKHIKNCGVLHCDIKPDNMLVNEANNVLKLSDFGSAMFTGKCESAPYLVSRFYRAPEIILGLVYDHPLDMWSVGCCLFEIFTGKVLFPGATNNHMLRLQMELKGLFPKKMVRKGKFKDQYFDEDLNFLAIVEDPVTKNAVIRRTVINIKPKGFGTLIQGSNGEDRKMLAHFKDLLEKNFMLDPEKRITVSQALSHPFITAGK